MCTTIEKKSTKNILQLSKEEKQKFINSFDYVLADCDGNIILISFIEFDKYV